MIVLGVDETGNCKNEIQELKLLIQVNIAKKKKNLQHAMKKSPTEK